jgi:tRNA threonylcarbamoyladenosine biosynthesis protein TsaE
MVEAPAATWRSNGPAETRRLGEQLAAAFQAGDTVALVGDIGAGKTVLVQGVAGALGVEAQVTSPTFVLVRPYRGRDGLEVWHADLYRLDAVAEVENLELADAAAAGALVLVEWGDGALECLSEPLWRVEIEVEAPSGDRLLKVFPPAGREIRW